VHLIALCCIGELGIGSAVKTVGDDELPGNSTTVDFGAGAVVSSVSVGNGFVCAIVDDTVKCWGDGQGGRIGQGNEDDLGGAPVTIPAKIKPIK
jgi:hypothetical protein